jgi:hypothetical protein
LKPPGEHTSTNAKELQQAKFYFPTPPPLREGCTNAGGDHYLEGALERVDGNVGLGLGARHLLREEFTLLVEGSHLRLRVEGLGLKGLGSGLGARHLLPEELELLLEGIYLRFGA